MRFHPLIQNLQEITELLDDEGGTLFQNVEHDTFGHVESMLGTNIRRFQEISAVLLDGSAFIGPGTVESDLGPKSFRVGGNVISDPNPAERKTPVEDGRVARVLLDPAQYHQDIQKFNALMKNQLR